MSLMLWIHLLKLLLRYCHIRRLVVNVGGVARSHVPSMTTGGSRWLNVDSGMLELVRIIVRLPLNHGRGMRGVSPYRCW